MKPEKVFLGWDRPALDSIVRYLSSRFGNRDELDLGSLVLVFSSARAGRRILEKLTLFAAETKSILTPPQIITVGAFPEMVYVSPRPIASKIEATLAWSRALASLDPEKLSLITGIAPGKEDVLSWLPIARNIQSLYSELSAESISFRKAGEVIRTMPTALDDERWDTLAQVHQEYVRELESVGLIDREEARQSAVKAGSVSFDGHVFFCAVRDMNGITKRIVDILQNSVASLIFAPESASNAFDQYGSVIADSWLNRDLSVSEDTIVVASDPVDQAVAALKVLSDLKGAVHQSEIAIGQTDTALIPFIDSVFKEAGLTLHDPGGKPLRDTRPVVLLGQCSTYLAQRSFRSFLSLCRVPEIDSYVKSKIKEAGSDIESLSAHLDMYQTEHMQAFSHSLPAAVRAYDKTTHETVAIIDALLEPFSRSKRPLDSWVVEIEKLFSTLYPELETFKDEFDVLRSAWEPLSLIPKSLIPFVTGAEAISLLLHSVSDLSIPVLRDSTAIEALGWLELQLEDVPAIIVCGMNEGSVPESVNADSYLPESVRKQLGLLDNSRRYARDAFVLESLIHSVPNLSLIFSRVDSKGSPLAPSRLLMMEQDSSFVSRVERLYVTPPVERTLARGADVVSKGAVWEIPPKPRPINKKINSISVTGFRSYIQCPYRFYLKHVLSLQHIDDSLNEMDGAVFGKLGHSVLAEYAESDASKTSDASMHREALSNSLDSQFTKFFGASPLPAVLIQREQLRSRLSRFAERNAEWRAQGWVTKYIEHKPTSKGSTITVEDEPFIVEGRIDRIDYHPIKKAWAVFDYKLSESAQTPGDAHRNKKGWKDLQLPLYNMLLRNDGFEGEILLGYIMLSSDTQVGDMFSFVDWNEEDHQEASALAHTIAAQVKKQIFWPPAEGITYPDEFDPLMGISQFYEPGGEDVISA